MANSKVETQVTWSAASSVTVSSATVVWSDAFAFNADDMEAELQVNVETTGTAATGDVCTVYVAYSTGDILGDSGNDFATPEHAEFAMQLDTYASNTPGEDPACRSTPLRVAPTACKIGVSCPLAASRSMTVRARISTARSA